MSHWKPHPRHRQSGAMTLLVGLLLLIGAGILTFSATRTSVIEQRIANNEFRAREAQQAAQAGLEYALAWLAENLWIAGDSEPTPPPVTAASGYVYRTRLTFTKQINGVCARAQVTATTEPEILANAWECFNQTGLFDSTIATTMPPPLAITGCLAEPTEPAELFVLNANAVMTGSAANASCLPQGSLDISSWSDTNDNRILEPLEEGASASFNRTAFGGCPGTLCAWNHLFDMTLDDAKTAASVSGHVYTNHIPCGAAAPPGIYLIQTTAPIDAVDLVGSCSGEDGVDDDTIGTPRKPILLIVPKESGCPSFNEGVRIHGIVYYESATACATQGWGGASVHGSVIWEGDAGAPATNARFIETDYGAGSNLNDAFQTIRGATRIPGTWRDWESD